MVRIPAGSYLPLYSAPPADSTPAAARAARRTPVAAFAMDVRPVTNTEFLAFVREHPQWRRSRVAPLFADGSYLRHWRSDLELGDLAPPNSPVVNVSWFAARAYLKARGKALPTVDQWEYVAAASETRVDASRDTAFLARLRGWYARPTPGRLPPVGSTYRNLYGIDDLHGLVWEWTLDFNSALVTGESRGDASLDRSLYCGSGAAGAADFEDYAAFMRYAFRSSLAANYCVANLGFRGVIATPEPPQ
jgi:formylglycine-generating enzyme required for sulfatase activity